MGPASLNEYYFPFQGVKILYYQPHLDLSGTVPEKLFFCFGCTTNLRRNYSCQAIFVVRKI
jgi:hypothetical protein